MKLELIKLGEFKDSTGKLFKITSIIIKEIKETFRGRSPITVGHSIALSTYDGFESRGKVNFLDIENDSLIADINLTKDTQKQWDEDKLINWSAGIGFGDQGDGVDRYYLHHVALLGASPPAIPNLGVVSLSQNIFSMYNTPNGEIKILTAPKEQQGNSMTPEEIKQLQKEKESFEAKTKELEAKTKELEASLSKNENDEITSLKSQIADLNHLRFNDAKENFKNLNAKRFKEDTIETFLEISNLSEDILNGLSILLSNQKEQVITGNVLEDVKETKDKYNTNFGMAREDN